MYKFRRIVRQQTGRPTRHRRRRRISRGAFLARGGTAAAGFALGGVVAWSRNRVLTAPTFSDYPFMPPVRTFASFVIENGYTQKIMR